MTDKPIIFSASMVQALLAGRKNQTRRLLNPQPDLNDAGLWRYPPDSVCNGVDPKLWVKRFGGFCQTDAEGLASFLLHPSNGRRLLPYAPGDRLYVREAWHAARSLDDVAPRDISLDASIEHAATAAEQRAGFVEAAKVAREQMLKTGKGLDTDEVHAYLKARIIDKKATKPKAKSWQS